MRKLVLVPFVAALMAVPCVGYGAVDRLPEPGGAARNAPGPLADAAACGRLGLSMPASRAIDGTRSDGSCAFFSLAVKMADLRPQPRAGGAVPRAAGGGEHDAELGTGSRAGGAETVAMLVAALALMGFVARRRRADDLP